LKKAIFLDRDGTINYDSKDYIKSAEEFKLFPFSVEALVKLYQKNFELIIITNQSGISRGFFTDEDLQNIHNKLIRELDKQDAKLLDIFYCPHSFDSMCQCRKPNTGNIIKAVDKYNIDLSKSWFVGDSEKDIIAGNNSGCKTAFVLSGVRGLTKEIVENWKIKPDLIEENLLTTADKIIELENL